MKQQLSPEQKQLNRIRFMASALKNPEQPKCLLAEIWSDAQLSIFCIGGFLAMVLMFAYAAYKN